MPFHRFILFLLLAASVTAPFDLFAASPAPAAIAPANYEIRLADARRLGAEGSWALARDAYAEALKLAPSDDTRRWCELWLEDATWRAEDPREWRDYRGWQQRHRSVLDALLASYAKDRTRDDFWMAAMANRAGVAEAVHGWDERWVDLLAIADHLASQSLAPESVSRYIDYLKTLVPSDRSIPSSAISALTAHLDTATRVASSADDRAWFALQAAAIWRDADSTFASHSPEDRYEPQSPEQARQSAVECAGRWTEALGTARGTHWEPLGRAQEFLWRQWHGWNPDRTPDTPADYPALLAELGRLRTALQTTTRDKFTEQTLGALDVLENEWTLPNIALEIPQSFRPGETVRFSYGATGLREVHFAVYRHSLESWASTPPERRDYGESPTIQRTADAPLPAGAELVHSWSQALTGLEKRVWHSEVAALETKLGPGAYTLRLSGDGPVESICTQRTFLVTNAQAATITTDTGSIALFLFKGDSGEPVANTAVQGLVTWNKASQAWQGASDAEGRVSLSPSAKEERSDFENLFLFAGGEPVFLRRYRHSRGRERSLLADLFTDRPLYRPGETVKWKVIVRERRDGRWVVPDSKLHMTVELNNDLLLNGGELSLNAFGSAHGELPIPATASPGGAHLTLTRSGASQREFGATIFRVDNFVPPAITAAVALVSPPDSLRPGGEIVLRVTAQYLSGGPVVGSSVRCQLDAYSDVETEVKGHADETFARWKKELADQPLVRTTNARGMAEFRLTLPSALPAITTLSVRAQVTPEGAPAVQADTHFRINGCAAWLDPLDWRASRLAQPGVETVFTARVMDGEMKPRAFDGTARFVERSWQEVWLAPDGRLVAGPDLRAARRQLALTAAADLPPPWKRLHADYVDLPVAELPVRTGTDGQFTAAFTPPRAGLFQCRLWREDQAVPVLFGESESEALSIVAADANTETLNLPADDCRIVAPGRWRHGEPLRLFAVLPEGQHQGILVLSGEEAAAAQRVDLRGRAGLVEIAAPPHFSHFGAAALSPLQRTSYSSKGDAGFKVEYPDEAIAIVLQPGKADERPGSAASIVIRATDAHQKPVRAELALSVADEAIHQLYATHPRRYEVPPTDDPVFLRTTSSVYARIEAPFVGKENPLAPLPDPRAGNEHALKVGYGYGLGGVFDIPGSFAQAIPPPPLEHIRSHFDFTAFWAPEVVTDQNGEVRLSFKYLDSLTEWRFEAYAIGDDGNSFGRAATFTRTSLPFQARLQLPRFLVAGDTATPSALLVNRTDADLIANAELKITGAVQFLPVGAHLGAPAPRTDERAQQAAPLQHESILVTKQGEAHTAWQIRATQRGEGNLTLTARAGAEGDAMALSLPVLEDGIQQETAASGRLAAGTKKQLLHLPLPKPLDPARTTVNVQLSPGHAAAILDALPYLVDYPYGCIEQTVSRFLPAVVVRKTLVDFGLDAAAVEERILARESKADAARRAKTAGLGKLDEVVQSSLARLAEAQRDNGSFGWWPGASSPDLWMTAYVMWGLNAATAAGVKVPEHLSGETPRALRYKLETTDRTDDHVVWAMVALVHNARNEPSDKPSEKFLATYSRLYAAREKLSPAGRACLALAMRVLGDADQRAVLLRNLENGAQRVRSDDFGDTVHWGSTDGYWRAMDSAVESTALTLLALLELDPKHPLIEPAANWLVLNRRSSHWASTRDTTFAVMALARYVTLRGEAKPDAEVELLVNGKPVRRLKLTRESLLEGPLTLPIEPTVLRPGDNRIELRRVDGKTPVFAVALASSWAPSETVKPAGHLSAVARSFVRQKAELTLAGTLRITPEPLPNGGSAVAGEQVTARVTLTVPNELEYVMVEVPKPAGCEPLNPLSGWDARLLRVEAAPATAAANDKQAKNNSGGTGEDAGRPVYREEHDDKSVFFLDHVEAGTWEIRFGLRATTPGDYRALPVKAQAMYVPEVRANSDARRVRIITPEADQSRPLP
jgi:uncharacterized protein YfaS (alpha-2-macroglobulin family)